MLPGRAPAGAGGNRSGVERIVLVPLLEALDQLFDPDIVGEQLVGRVDIAAEQALEGSGRRRASRCCPAADRAGWHSGSGPPARPGRAGGSRGRPGRRARRVALRSGQAEAAASSRRTRFRLGDGRHRPRRRAAAASNAAYAAAPRRANVTTSIEGERRQLVVDRGQGDLGGLVDRVAADAGAERREGDARDVVLAGPGHRAVDGCPDRGRTGPPIAIERCRRG